METLMNFFQDFYSIPIAFYSIPFSVFLLLMFLSILGISIGDGEMEFESGFLQSVFAHFGLVRVPVTLFLFFMFMFGSIILIILKDIVDNDLVLSISAVIVIYPSSYLSSKILRFISPIFFQEEQERNYIGATATVSSHIINAEKGYIDCIQDGLHSQLNAYTNGEEILKGTSVMILLYDEETKKYLVEKI